MVKEIERKFILKRFPFSFKFDKTFEIVQFYNNGWRYRSEVGNTPQYFRMKKISVGLGVATAMETEPEEVSEREFNVKLSEAPTYIWKTRSEWTDPNDPLIKFFVDRFHGMNIIMLEVEIPTLFYRISIPREIQQEIADEVTGLIGFSNINLQKNNIKNYETYNATS
jgi:CYTH domain-containing protein